MVTATTPGGRVVHYRILITINRRQKKEKGEKQERHLDVIY